MNLKHLHHVVCNSNIKPMYRIPDYYGIKNAVSKSIALIFTKNGNFYFNRTRVKRASSPVSACYCTIYRMNTDNHIRPDLDQEIGTISDFEAKNMLWEVK